MNTTERRATAVIADADWSLWRDPHWNLWLWQAVLLSMNREPTGNESLDIFRPDAWSHRFKSGDDTSIYWQATTLGPLLTRAVHGFVGTLSTHLVNSRPDDPSWRPVVLGEFCDWAHANGWEVDARMPRITSSSTPVSKSESREIQEPRRDDLAIEIVGILRANPSTHRMGAREFMATQLVPLVGNAGSVICDSGRGFIVWRRNGGDMEATNVKALGERLKKYKNQLGTQSTGKRKPS